MKRRHRQSINEPGHAHELTFSCCQGLPFLKCDAFCEWLAESIDSARRTLDFHLWAFVFMPNHVHVIVYPRGSTYDMAQVRKAIKAPVGQKVIEHFETSAPEWIPRITRVRGSRTERLFWQSGGGYDRNITDGRTLMRMIDYIHANPVRQELVERPRDWQWSSAAWFDDLSAIPLAVDPIPPDWLEDS